MRETDDHREAGELGRRLAAQAERAAVPPDLLDGVRRRHHNIRRRRTAVRMAAATFGLLVVAGLGYGLTRFGPAEQQVEAAADVGSDVARAGRCDGGSPPDLQPDWAVAVLWLEVGIDDADLGRVTTELETSPLVTRYHYAGPEWTYEEFVHHFADQPEVIDLVEPEQLPTSFRLELTGGSAVTDLGWLETLAGVDQLEGPSRQCVPG